MYGCVPASTSGFTRRLTRRLPADGPATRDRRRSSLADSTLKHRMSCLEREPHVGLALADAGEDDLARIAAGRDHAGQFADGHDVEARPQTRQQVQDGDIGTGLDGEADQMLAGVEGRIEGAPLAFYRSARIDVARGADLRGDGAQINVLGVEDAAAVRKIIHGDSLGLWLFYPAVVRQVEVALLAAGGNQQQAQRPDRHPA
jgi:hypothetical protein